jgi:hypothetical protein
MGVDPRQSDQLREKINAYAGFILDGSLARHYPETVGRSVRIQLDCMETPTGDFAAITDHAARALEGLDIGFRVNVLG